LLLFDLPARDTKLRLRLWRWLRGHRFGYLQLSIWLTPDAMDEACCPLQNLNLTPESFTVIEGRPVAPDSDADIVMGAWDFAAINQRYQRAIDVASAGRELAEDRQVPPAKLRKWLAMEREAWLAAVSLDPLLPQALLPAGYLGQKAWKERQATFGTMIKRKRELND
jgi:DNA-binding transcriptional regulator PaaX